MPSRNTSNQNEVAAEGRVDSASHLSIPSLIRNRLWLRYADDIVQYVVIWTEQKIYIRKRAEHEFPEDNGEVLKEVKVIQNRWLSLPAVIRHMLWLRVGDSVEYVTDPLGRLRFYIRKKL